MKNLTKKTIKTFKDLEFKIHPNHPYFETASTMSFDNGFGVSVVTGESAYSSESSPYEIAILHNDSLTYDTHITDDVIGHQTESDVTKVMGKVQKLEAIKK